jgi:hypothetical protein
MWVGAHMGGNQGQCLKQPRLQVASMRPNHGLPLSDPAADLVCLPCHRLQQGAAAPPLDVILC